MAYNIRTAYIMIKSRGEKIFSLFNYILMTIFALMFIYPMWDVVRVSISSSAEVGRMGFRIWPSELSSIGYRFVLANEYIWSGYRNTFIRIVIGVTISMVLMILCAFPLAKRDLPFRTPITMFIVFTMFFSGGLIPNYILIRSLGMYDTIWALVLPGAIPTFSMLIMRNFFLSLPVELEDSARIDGAGYTRTVISIVLPLSTAMLATLALWSIVGHWNAWFDNLLYIKDGRDYGLQAILRKIIIDAAPAYSPDRVPGEEVMILPSAEVTKCATIIVSTLPILCFYPFVQKYFVKGIMIGGLKG